MITAADYGHLVQLLGQQAHDDIAWANNCKPPADAVEFALETIYVICNSGMRFTVARGIYERVTAALRAGRSAHTAFKHEGKARAINSIWRRRRTLHSEFLAKETDEDRLAFIADLPWIGDITKYHLAKNFGAKVAKPDVHLQRLADREHCTVQQLCERLARQTGHGVPAVDTILWRACATGVLNSKTGKIKRDLQP